MNSSTDETDSEEAHPEWTLSQERVFVAELVHKRLTLYLTFFAIVMAGALNTASEPTLQILILVVGTVVCGALGETVVRSHEKLDIILRKINQDPRHPVSRVHQSASSKKRFHIVGVFVPRFCTVILMALLVISIAQRIPGSVGTAVSGH